MITDKDLEVLYKSFNSADPRTDILDKICKDLKEVERLRKQIETRQKDAFKYVSNFIKRYYPFSYGRSWDKKHAKLDFIFGIWSLQEYIDHFAQDDVDIEAFIKEMEDEKSI